MLWLKCQASRTLADTATGKPKVDKFTLQILSDPENALAAANLGFTDLLVAEDYTTEGLVRLLRHSAQEEE